MPSLRPLFAVAVSVMVLIAGGQAAFSRSSAPDLVTTAAGAPRDPKFSPGAFGPLKVGMRPRAAVRTGMATVTRTEICPQRHLELKDRYEPAFLSTYGGRIRAIGVGRGGTYRSTAGIGIGSTRVELRRAYGDRLRGPFIGEYGNAVFDVKRGNGYIDFFFPDERSQRVSFITVARGAPFHEFEGGPCSGRVIGSR